MVPETWESFVKLPQDATWTMEQVSSELRVNRSTSVGWHLQAAPKLSTWGYGFDFMAQIFSQQYIM